jgi:hypothetical protein
VLRFWTSEHGAGVNALVMGILVLIDAIWALNATRGIDTGTQRLSGGVR